MTPYIKSRDHRLKSDNYLFEMTIDSYYRLTKDRLKDNRYQRKRVKNSTSVYSLLKKDLTEGCLMPPIVLALEGKLDDNQDIMHQLFATEQPLLILDGLQRSYTIKDLVEECENSLLDFTYSQFKDNPIRIELYTGINRSALLYRMLTLNTGQTRMSTRHQIEIIYSDFLTTEVESGIRLITANDSYTPKKIGEYAFRDVIEGFTSYLMQDELLLDRGDILQNVRELERLTSMQKDDKDLFADFIECYTYFVTFIDNSVSDSLNQKIDEYFEDLKEDGNNASEFTPFGRNAMQIFNKSQALTGFGSAIAKLQGRGDLKNFDSVRSFIDQINKETATDGLFQLILDLEKLRPYAKKIGDDQRFYFNAFFRFLFDSDLESRSLETAASKAWRMYYRDNL